jgi:hypothetical protein
MAARPKLDGDIIASSAAIGAVVGGGVGGVLGLVIGLIVHPATAWFAVIELGFPGAVLGLPLGAAVGLGLAIRQTRQPRS